MKIQDRARQDTIKFIDGAPFCSSDSTPVSLEDLKITIDVIKGDEPANKAIESLSNLDTKENKAYTDSLKNIINSTTVEDIERMTESELIEFNKTYDRLKGIDTTYHKIGKLNLGTNYLDKRLSAQESAALVDNLRVINNLQIYFVSLKKIDDDFDEIDENEKKRENLQEILKKIK